MNNIPKPTKKVLNIKSDNGRKYVQLTFPKKKNGWSREQIKSVSKKVGRALKNKGENGSIQVCICDSVRWRSGKWTEFGTSVSLYSNADSDNSAADPASYTQFMIFIKTAANDEGGVNSKNSCFFDSITELIKDFKYETDEELKEYLGLEEDSMISIKHMPAIQKLIPNYKLMITGDHIWTSVQKSPIEIHIKLEDKHYTPIMPEKKRVRGIAKREKIPLIYSWDNDKKTNLCFSKESSKVFKMDKKEFGNHYDKPMSSKYTLIPYDEELGTHRENLKAFVKKADLFKEQTDDRINFYKTGTNIKTIHEYFYSTIPNINPDKIMQDEAMWISSSMKGGLIYAEKYEGQGYDYDVISHYPAIQRDNKMLFPIRRGEFMSIPEEEFNEKKFYSYGIYRCIIKKDSSKEKLFRWNNENYYTHFDLTSAKKLGLDINIIVDKKPNALIYSREKLVGGQVLFREYVDTLYEMKNEGITDAKKMLNMLWGSLVQRDKFSQTIRPDDEYEMFKGRDIDKITPYKIKGEDRLKLSIVKQDNLFVTNFARIGPFLISKGRLKICELLIEHYDLCKHIHTDGFILSKKVDLKIGNQIGDLKLVKSGTVEVIHCNKKIWK